MPPNPTLDQRLEWHAGHAANCACRDMPDEIRAELAKRGMLPDQANAPERPTEAS